MPIATTATRYREIAATLRGRIRAGRFAVAGKLPVEHDLAAEFGVNRLTLRKAVGLLEAEGLVTRHRGLGTFVGQARAASGTRQALLFIGDVGAHFWGDIYAALAACAQDAGGLVHSLQPGAGEHGAAELHALLARVAEPCIAVCQANQWPLARPVLEAARVATVVIALPDQDGPCPVPVVAPDMWRAGLLATAHLLALGHTRIAFLGFGSDPAPGPGFFSPFPANLPYCGYLSALRQAGIPEPGLAMGTYGSGEPLRAQLRAFLAYHGGWPTAFVCQQDFKARDVLVVAAEQGLRVPREVSVISIGNTPWSEAQVPALTSVDLRPRELAQLAWLLARQGLVEPLVHRLEPRLVHRESVAAPPLPEES